MRPRDTVSIDLASFDAFLFDLDGVITRTAGLHASAWEKLFDDYLLAEAQRTGAAFVPFDIVADYRAYVDGKPRHAGVRDFLAARGIRLPEGAPQDDPSQDTVHGLGKRKDRYTVSVNAMHCVAPSIRVAVNGEIHHVAASETRRFSLK